MSNKVVVICSGGLDSTVALYQAVAEGKEPSVLSFNYGQRHSKELSYAKATAWKLNVPHFVVGLQSLQHLLRSSLTGESDVPEGHYAADNMKQTIVPNRNAIMLSIAYGYAISIGAQGVVIGAHAGDHPIYPDCRSGFFGALEHTLQLGTDSKIQIITPFISISKAEIVRLGAELHVPFDGTWSCYKGGDLHCGRCGTCVERFEAFSLAGVEDPTKYADSEYWKEAVKQGA